MCPNMLRQFVEEIDADIGIWTEINTKALTNVDPCQAGTGSAGPAALDRERFFERAAKRNSSWTGTAFPTAGLCPGRRDVADRV